MELREEWKGFNPAGLWTSEVNVRDFIQANYTPYDGDTKFLAGPTDAKKKLFEELMKLQKAEHDKNGVLDMDTKIVTGITAHEPGYICPE